MEKNIKIERHRKLMGSPFSIVVFTLKKAAEMARNSIELAFAEITRIENLLTEFREGPITRINQAAGIGPVRVPREVIDVIDYSLRISRDSDGTFDITHAALGHLWREAAQREAPPSLLEIENARRLVDYRLLAIDHQHEEIFLPVPGMRIGLGGIGKGYAVDRAFHLLRQHGLENIMVNGAGDIRVHSAHTAPRPWRVAIRNPFAQDQRAIAYFKMFRGAVATSGDYERAFRLAGHKIHHVLDPRTGWPTQDIASVSVISESALLSDVFATSTMTMGLGRGLNFLRHRARVSAYVVTKTGAVHTTDTWRAGGLHLEATHA